MSDQIMVSIICNTYNHEKYIRDALNSFVNQKTSFKFEVLVHDDASTDGTANIIKEFEKQYPNIIKPIYQKENQYSKGVKIGPTFQYPRIRGKYVAFCEGDDYWIDMSKLQISFDFLESHPDYGAVFHSTLQLNMETKEESLLQLESPYNRDYMFKDALDNSCHTSSFFLRTNLVSITPKYLYSYKKVGDWPRKIMLTDNSKVYYVSKTMSVYRLVSNPTSFSYKQKYSNKLKGLVDCSLFLKCVSRWCSKRNRKLAKRRQYHFYKLLVLNGGTIHSCHTIDYALFFLVFKTYILLKKGVFKPTAK